MADASDVMRTLVQVFQNLNVAKYVGVASATVLVYDWTLTIDEEIAFVWPSKWGWPKILYMLNRYTVFADVGLIVYVLLIGRDPKTCVSSFQAVGGSSAFGFAIAQIILAMRTWAIWGRRTWVTVILSTLIVCTLSVDIYLLIRYLGNISYVTSFTTSMDGCLLQFGNRIIYADFIEIIVLETTMLTLLVYRALQNFRHSRSTLMTRMLNDGVVYFLYIFVSSIINLCTILLAPIELHNMFIITQRVFHSIFCTRVLLHIRGAYTNNALAVSSVESSGAGVVGQSSSRSAHLGFRRNGVLSVDTDDVEERAEGVFELVDASKRDGTVRFSGRVYGDGVAGGWGHGHGFDSPRSPTFSTGADDKLPPFGLTRGFDVE